MGATTFDDLPMDIQSDIIKRAATLDSLGICENDMYAPWLVSQSWAALMRDRALFAAVLLGCRQEDALATLVRHRGQRPDDWMELAVHMLRKMDTKYITKWRGRDGEGEHRHGMCCMRALKHAHAARLREFCKLVMAWRPIAEIAVFSDGFVGMKRLGLRVARRYPAYWPWCRE